MALSAEERRQWDELEHQLAAEAPRLVQLTRGRGMKRPAADSTRALVMVFGAFLVLILAVIVKIPLIGVLGIILMIFGGIRFHVSGRMSGRKSQPAKEPTRRSGDVL